MTEPRPIRYVFTNGTFDLLHAGHFNLLLLCRQYAGRGGVVVVGLDSDEKVQKDKGIQKPFFTFKERKDALLSLKFDSVSIVDDVQEFNTNEELHEMIKVLKPEFLIKGDDWKGNVVGEDIAKNTVLFPKNNYSSTKIIQRVLEKSLTYDFRNEAIKVDPFEI